VDAGGFGFRACGERLTAEVIDGVLLFAAMHGWRRQIVQHGRHLCGDALDLAWRTRDAVVPVGHTAR
jgi:arginine decarboxylase